MADQNQEYVRPTKATLPSLAGSKPPICPSSLNLLAIAAREKLVVQKKAEIADAREKEIEKIIAKRGCGRQQAEEIVDSCGERHLNFQLPATKKSRAKKPYP